MNIKETRVEVAYLIKSYNTYIHIYLTVAHTKIPMWIGLSSVLHRFNPRIHPNMTENWWWECRASTLTTNTMYVKSLAM